MRLALPLVLLLVAGVPVAQAQASEVTIAILDSGVDGQHAELAGRVSRLSFVDYFSAPQLPEPFPQTPPLDPTSQQPDPNGQGTAAASIAAGATLGAAPTALVLDLQVRAQPAGSPVEPEDEEAASRAMDYLLRQEDPPMVVLLGFASEDLTPQGAETLAAQAQALRGRGVAVIVPISANPNPLTMSPHVFTVSCVEQCGGTGQGSPTQVLKPDLSADGAGRTAAAPSNPVDRSPRTTVTGTAFAAADVAGQAARAYAERPDLPVDALFAILRDTAVDVGEPGPDNVTGHGALDGNATYLRAVAWSDPLGPTGGKDAPGVQISWLVLLVASVGLASRARARKM